MTISLFGIFLTEILVFIYSKFHENIYTYRGIYT